MKTLFIGSVKSGKSRLAETFVLQTLPRYADKPYYLATSELLDEEMKQRVVLSQQRREDRFITLEEPLKLMASLKKCHNTTVLVASVSMWLNNMLHHQFTEARILQELFSSPFSLPLQYPGKYYPQPLCNQLSPHLIFLQPS